MCACVCVCVCACVWACVCANARHASSTQYTHTRVRCLYLDIHTTLWEHADSFRCPCHQLLPSNTPDQAVNGRWTLAGRRREERAESQNKKMMTAVNVHTYKTLLQFNKFMYKHNQCQMVIANMLCHASHEFLIP